MTIQPDEVKEHKAPPGYTKWYEYYRNGRHERYGPIILSIQANYISYCSPRETWLPSLEDYNEVEIAMWDLRESDKPNKVGFATLGKWIDPAYIGIKGFEDILNVEYDQVAGYVPWSEVNALREKLTEHYAARELDIYTIDMHTRNVDGYTEAEFEVFCQAGPDAVEIYRSHKAAQQNGVGNYPVVGDMPYWMKAIMDKFEEAANGAE